LLTKIIRTLGYALLVVGIAAILLGTAMVWMREGFTEAAWLFSPLNVRSWFINVLTVAPGLALLMWAQHRDHAPRLPPR
jgi:hypothetical protein